MKYKVLKPIIYDGRVYNAGDEVNVYEKDVAENCLTRGLILETTKDEKPKASKSKKGQENKE